MYLYIIVIMLDLLTHFSTRGVLDRGLRVYKGLPDSGKEFPFVVMLQRNTGTSVMQTSKFCTGILIEARWVLTAAHCVQLKSAKQMLIKYGEYTRLPNETKLYKKVIKIIVHTRNKELTNLNDIALLLVERVPIKDYARLGAFDHKTLFGVPAKYAGFGLIQEEQSNIEFVMQMQLIPLQVGEGILVPCESKFGLRFPFVKYSTVCVTPKCSNKEQQIRAGDSGGPLVHDGRLVGVCKGRQNIASSVMLYTVVSPYIDWIQNTIRLNNN